MARLYLKNGKKIHAYKKIKKKNLLNFPNIVKHLRPPLNVQVNPVVCLYETGICGGGRSVACKRTKFPRT